MLIYVFRCQFVDPVGQIASTANVGPRFLMVQSKREGENNSSGRNDMDEARAPVSGPNEPEEIFGWKTAITYGLISMIMLSLTAFAYVERQAAVSQQRRAELSQQQAESAFIDELASLLTKKAALREAQSQVETLGREIQTLPTVAAQDKARLSGTSAVSALN
jgi:hypothetical protein